MSSVRNGGTLFDVMQNKTSVQKTRKQTSASALRKSPPPPGDDLGAAELAQRVAAVVRDKRKARGLSLDLLAKASGVSRATLSQVETQKCSPSLGVLWKISVGLGVPFSDLLGGQSSSVSVLRRGDTQVLRSADGRLESGAVVARRGRSARSRPLRS